MGGMSYLGPWAWLVGIIWTTPAGKHESQQAGAACPVLLKAYDVFILTAGSK
jgi:hypothetical protein